MIQRKIWSKSSKSSKCGHLHLPQMITGIPNHTGICQDECQVCRLHFSLLFKFSDRGHFGMLRFIANSRYYIENVPWDMFCPQKLDPGPHSSATFSSFLMSYPAVASLTFPFSLSPWNCPLLPIKMCLYNSKLLSINHDPAALYFSIILFSSHLA